MNYSKTTLQNGLRVVSIPMPQVKSVAALVMIGAGSRHETKKINGLSHFLEHMAFKGTKKRPNKLAISSLIDGIGGHFSAFTGKEYTGFYIKAESRHLELILDVLSDILTNSLFDAKEMDKERAVITEEINMYEDLPQERVGELFEKLLYGDHPLSWRVSGEKENIANVSRQELVDYAKNMYHSKSIVVGVAGGVDPAHGRDDVNKYFGCIPDGNENKFIKIFEKQSKPQSIIYSKKTDQAHLCIGVRSYDMNHPDRFSLAVLGTILGGNMSSRLFSEVREKRGLAYYINADNAEFYDTGYFVTQAGVNLSNTSEAIKVILEEFDKLKNNLILKKELRMSKNYARGKMALALEDSFRVASYYTSQELLKKKIETPEEVLEKIEAVTAEDIQRVAKDIFVNQKLNLAVIGPFKKEEMFDKLLVI